jgi:chaperonin GroES
MKLQSLGTRVLVKMDPPEQEIGRFFIPDAYLQRDVVGTVVSIGEYVELADVGDRVLIRQHSGIDLVIDNDDYTIVQEDDILARLVDEQDNQSSDEIYV